MKKEEDEFMKAIRFSNGPRGQYIIGQALWYAIEAMEKVPDKQKEPSNIADMKYLMENVYPTFNAIQELKKMKEEVV